ncbi:S8 family serine peptidase [Antribacter sp. KLBMP9083]|uniref:S8 family serine peptidase n=1 Tax=Antribacter soli TaxID=2910976 RepID=A0AA41QBT6_9MICO|nr:S8 family serine peptidase [Antribacter soli]MCF4120565.1 S8 family serine peptidase [Antribacter soli]
MHRRTALARRASIAVSAIVALAATSAVSVVPALAAPAPTTLHTDVIRDAADKFTSTAHDQLEAGKADFWVKMSDTADLAAAKDIADWGERGQYVHDALTTTAQASQASTLAELEAAGVEYEPYWISNRVLVKSGTLELATSLAASVEVEEIHETVTLEIPEPVAVEPSTADGPNAPEWGLEAINAPEAWAMGATGAGIVVSNNDTGVQVDHPALAAQYRGKQADGTIDNNYSWGDTSSACGGAPCDSNGHGTHTIGTMVGDDGGSNQIGVAPDAKWIAVNGCDTCSDADLLEAGEWIAAPTDLAGQNPDVTKRPHVVNNSWGYRAAGTIDDWYSDITSAWEAAGIFGAWSAGNSGSACTTTSSPGANTTSYSSGAFDANGAIASFSSRGPGEDGLTKPNIAAPGVSVRSSIPGSGYAAYSGTSMAAPHLAGAVALLWSYAPSLVGDIEETKRLLDESATDVDNTTCGGTAADNNVWGEGKLDVVALLELAPLAAGTFSGTVTGDGGPVAGASVAFDGPTDRTVTTGADGAFTVMVEAGDYSVAASAFGFVSETTTATVAAEGSTTVDFDLVAAPRFAVTGTVTESVTGGVVAGTAVTLSPGGLSTTSGADGRFSFADVPAGTYTIGTPATACAEASSAQVVVDGAENVPLSVTFKYDDGGYFCAVGAGSYLQGDTLVALTGDDRFTSVAIPFAFPLYGADYSTAYVSTNGFLNFLAGTSSLSNGAIPSTAVPNAALYPFWDDLYFDVSAGLYQGTSTIDGVQAFTLEWRNVRKYSPSTDRLNFSVTLFEDGKVVYGYGDLTETATAKGSSATVGLENATGTVASQYSYNSASLSDGVSITYDLAPMGTVTGVVKDYNTKAAIAGASVTVTAADGDAKVLTTGADGTYSVDLVIGRYGVVFEADDYTAISKDVNVTEGVTLTTNAQLKAGRLAVSTTAVGASLAMGGSVSRNIKVTNTGSAPAVVNLSAGDGGFGMLGATSTETAVIKGVEGTATVPGSSKPEAGSGLAVQGSAGLSGSGSGVAGTSVMPEAAAVPLGEETITHSASQAIVANNSVACTSGSQTQDNAYLRTFTLADFGIDGAFDVSSVSFGVEVAGVAQPLTVKLYSLDGALTYANMTLIGSAEATVAAGTSAAIVNVPVVGSVPQGGTLAVEIDVPAGGRLFIGSNDAGQTAPSYLRSEACSIPEPTDTADIGFPGMHVVMNVSGSTSGGAGVEWLDVQPPTFTLAPGQAVTAIATITAAVDQPGTYTAAIAIGNDTPYTVAPVTATMTVKAPAGWGKITGTVTGDGTPLDGAVVHLDGISYDVTLLTDADGTYAYWMQKSNAPLQVTVAAQGFIPKTAKAQIVAGQTTVYNFDLDPLP